MTDATIATLLEAELRALVRRLRAAEERLRADVESALVPDDDADARAALARLEGFASGLALAAQWLDALRARVPELATLARYADGPRRRPEGEP